MKIYICCDMEGVAGIIRESQLKPGERDYDDARILLLNEVNAVISGAMEAGADEIIVADMHLYGFNLPVKYLDPRAKYILGSHRPRLPHIEDFDALILLGYHAMAGTLSAVRDHTMSSLTWHNLYINGIRMGEVEIDAAIAGFYKVPTILVTGDDKVCKEARNFINNIVVAEVKEGFNRNSAMTLAPESACKLIKEKTIEAIKNIDNIKPFTVDEREVEIKIEYNLTEQADQIYIDNIHSIKIDSRTILFKGMNFLDAISHIF